MSKALRLAYFVFAVLFVVAVSAQVIMAGLALFWRSSLWESHVGLGHSAAGIPLIMLILALVGRLPMHLKSHSGLLLLGVVLQAEFFPLIRELSGLASAYHPFLAMLLFYGGVVLARRAWALNRAGIAQASLRPEASLGPETPAAVATVGPGRVAPPCDPLTSMGCG